MDALHRAFARLLRMGTTEDPEQKLVRSALMLQGKVALVPLPDCSVELTWRSPSATEWYHYDGRRSAYDFLDGEGRLMQPGALQRLFDDVQPEYGFRAYGTVWQKRWATNDGTDVVQYREIKICPHAGCWVIAPSTWAAAEAFANALTWMALGRELPDGGEVPDILSCYRSRCIVPKAMPGVLPDDVWSRPRARLRWT